MADTLNIIQFTLVCVERFHTLIAGEVSLIIGLQEEVKSIWEELNSMSTFLSSVDESAEEDVNVKEWVKQVRNLSYEIEDVIENYKLLQLENTVVGKVKQYIAKRNIATSIKSLREKAVEIGRRKESYSYKFNRTSVGNNNCVTVHQFTAPSVCVINESDLVGVEVAKGEVIDLLGLQELRDSVLCSTIAVIGMTGLGKTSVVLSVYNDAMVKDYFPIRALISTTRPSSRAEILRSIMKQFYEASHEHEQLLQTSNPRNIQHFNNPFHEVDIKDETRLQLLIRNYLKEKRYMVVIDGVQDQEGDRELANYLKKVLPTNNGNGSKILITTRYENMARIWVDGSNQGIYKLKPLVSTKAWELFCKKAFQNHTGMCPPSLEDLARDIVRRCEGVPLLVSEMGRFLSAKSVDLHEWKKVRNGLGFYMQEQDLMGVYKILIPSYQSLPQHLKCCFLYFGLFPKGYHVNRTRLIRLWIAEGFIKGGCVERASSSSGNNLTLEEVAEEYINQLIDRSLVEVQRTDATGKHTFLRVHEFLHDVIISKAKELDYLGISQTLPENNPIIINRPRHVSLHIDHNSNAIATLKSSFGSMANIRSFLLITKPGEKEKFSKAQENPWGKVLIKALNNSPLLKVVDFSDAPLHELPKEIEKLHNLHYLSLRNTGIVRLSSSICKLQYLQTLDLKHTWIQELPTELNRLHRLCHLLAYRYEHDVAFSVHVMKTTGVKVPKGALESLEELQKLAYLDVGHRSKVVKELRNLRKLRRLGITGLKLEDGRDLCDALKKMESLQALSVFAHDVKRETIDLDHFESSPPLTLKRLYLNGPLMEQTLPSWILELHSLVKIRLRWSCLNFVNPFEILKTLPNLVELQLLEAYLGHNLQIGAKGFEKLKTLNLLDLHNLESLSICKGALPVLELMSIGESPKLSVPLGIEYLSKLDTLNFFNMPLDFAHSLQQDGEYHYVVKHVPNVWYQRKNQASWETYFL